MKRFSLVILLVIPFQVGAQPKRELQEFSGVVKSFEPGYYFAYEKICLDIEGVQDCFLFYPDYGKFLLEKIRIGDPVSLKAMVNLKARESRKKWESEKAIPWFLYGDNIQEIKIDDEWIKLPPKQNVPFQFVNKIFIRKPVVKEFVEDGFKKGLLISNGVFFYDRGISKRHDPFQTVKAGDNLSLMGVKIPYKEGYVYPLSEVREVYHMTVLKTKVAEIQSLLFKQNHVCIGAKFVTESGEEVSVSFPSFRAQQIKDFVKPSIKAELFLGNDYGTQKFSLPELHAIIQGKDTLKIEEFGFYGGADGKHDHKDVGVVGKITHLERTAKGNVASIVVNSEYYVEIDAMMAQQIGYMFRKGLMISIIGKERIPLPGEIYKKNYKIVVPEKVVVDDKTFSLYQP